MKLSGPRAPIIANVSPFIPLSLIGVFSTLQLLLGASPTIVAMCAVAVAIPFLHLSYCGRDLYGVLGIGFCMQYPGMALVAKTLYGQTLESNLFDANATFSLILLLMFVLTAMLIVARALDRGEAFFQFPTDLLTLRRLSSACIFIGIIGNALFSVKQPNSENASPGGAFVVLGSAVRDFYYLGLIAETVYAIIKTDGRTFITKRLVVLFLIQVIFSISYNERGQIVACVIGIVTTAFLYNTIYIRHIVVGILASIFFVYVFTPITIYLRLNRGGVSVTEFAERAVSTFTKALTDPEYLKSLTEAEKYINYLDMKALVPYDYFGNRSDVLDRLTWVGLVDAAYNGIRTRKPIGMEGIEQSLARMAPGFLGYDKGITTIGPGDWLSWQTGLSEPGRVYFAVFGLPMEGLASWGLAGMIVYPFIFMLPVLFLCGRLSSLRLPLPVSIYLFVDTQHMMLEGTSDVFLAWATRNLPVVFLLLFALHYLYCPRDGVPAPAIFE